MSSIAIVGKSGTGKSTSYGQFPELGIKGLNPKETVSINVAGKDLRRDYLWKQLNFLATEFVDCKILKSTERYEDQEVDHYKNILVSSCSVARDSFKSNQVTILCNNG